MKGVVKLRLLLLGSVFATVVACSGNSENLTGAFVSWEPVDSAHGYANFTVTNNGTEVATASCTVLVRTDFGEQGFDYLADEEIQPGETKNLRMPLTVTGNSAANVTKGEVRDC